MDKHDEKPEGAPSADRRNFMKTVVTGTVAAGLVATVGKAEAATTGLCGKPVELPVAAVKAKVVFPTKAPPTLAQLHAALDEIIKPSGCPNCGLGGILKDRGLIRELVFNTGYLGDVQDPITLVEDFGAQGF
ncbi:twin-arginine translocation signal domain-containing protein [Pyxidicoccus sp. 3LG]